MRAVDADPVSPVPTTGGLYHPQQYLAAIVQSSQDAIIGKSLDGRIVSWNPAAQGLYGWSEAEAIGQSLSLLVPPEQLSDEMMLFARILAGEQIHAFEVQRINKANYRIRVSLSMSPIHEGSQIVGIATSSRRIDESRRIEARLAAIVESSHEAIIGKSPDGRILSWNRGAERLYGWSAVEVVGRSVDILVPTDALPLERELLARTLSGERVAEYELQRLHKQGRLLDVSLSMSPIFEGGQIVGVSSASRDAGERRRAARQFQRILDAAPDAMVCIDESGKITFVNDQVHRLFQFQNEDLIGTDVTRLLSSPAAWTDALRSYRMAAAAEESKEGALSLMATRKDGSSFAVDVRFAFLGEADGPIIAAIRDVTVREAIAQALRETDQALRASEDRFRQMTEAVPVGFLLRIAGTFEILYFSPGYMTILGLESSEEFSPEQEYSAIHPADLDRVAGAYQARADAGESAEVEFRVVGQSGKTRWVRATSTPVWLPDGTFKWIAATIEDVTERKHAEAALRSAQGEAERANAAKSEFLSRMSHELRTPLNAVLGFAQVLEHDELNRDQLEAVKHILRGGRHLLGLIDDVLDISRIETDDLDLVAELMPVSTLLSDTIGLMRPMASEHKVGLFLKPSDGPLQCAVHADPRRVRQVLLNLLSNAIKYNRPGGMVELSAEETPPRTIRLSVRDNGIGIPSEMLAKLFVPFERLGAESGVVPGTGIGLALSQRLVTRMGGSIDVESEYGVGTTFFVEFPCEAITNPSGPVHRLDLTQRQQNRSPAGGGVVLYIEDVESNVRLMQRVVAMRPTWKLIQAQTGTSGIELARQERPDLVLLDLHLPDMGGLEVVEKLRSAKHGASVPIWIVSADANLTQLTKLKEAGVAGYLTKPFNISEMLLRLDQSAAALLHNQG